MEIRIRSLSIKLPEKIKKRIKLNLSKLATHYDFVTRYDVLLKIDKQRGKDNFLAELTAQVRGKLLFTSANAPTPDLATDTALSEMETQLSKIKEKWHKM